MRLAYNRVDEDIRYESNVECLLTLAVIVHLVVLLPCFHSGIYFKV